MDSIWEKNGEHDDAASSAAEVIRILQYYQGIPTFGDGTITF
jgi:hypothetical protein